MTEIFTIGHSNHELDNFLRLLTRHGTRVLVDVRSDPYSRYSPQFNKNDFQRAVAASGIEYRYSGNLIGGKPKDATMYTPAGKPDYDKIASTEAFQTELRAVADIAATKRLVIMCSEADPMACHRERIIAQVLRSWGIKVTHIMPDGTAEQVAQQGLF